MTTTGLNMAAVHEAIAAKTPDRLALVFRDRRFTWADFNDRTRRFANAMGERGLGPHAGGRAGLAGHESHQDHVAIYCYNGNEYLEAMIGSYKGRVAPLNVNYRYVADELRHVLADSNAGAVVFHSEFAPTLAEVLPDLPNVRVLLQVADDSGNDLLPNAEWYEDALAAASPELPKVAGDWSPDDLYILYTGGTTGLPKGVLWRQADIFQSAMGGRRRDNGEPFESPEAVADVAAGGGLLAVLTPPFMHGASQWISGMTLHGGGTVMIPDVVNRLDAKSVLDMIHREKANFLQIVGDAFAQPILAELEKGDYDVSSLFMILSGGAALSEGAKTALLEAVPQAMIIDGMGSSEGGSQGTQVSMKGGPTSTGSFGVTPGTCILDADLTRVLDTTDTSDGWMAKAGDVPLGYLGDEAKTAKTFPVIDGVRYSVPGDRARWNEDGTVEVLGRDSVTINSGGEKIFAEEVEAALRHHDSVYDVVVAGRPSERWGNEVVAIIQLKEGTAGNPDELSETASRYIARFKLPKDYVFVTEVVRSPSGKPDYRWAKDQAIAAAG